MSSPSSRQPSGRLDLGSSTQLAALGDLQYETGSVASSTERRLSAVILTDAVHPRVHPANVSLLCRVKNRTSRVWKPRFSVAIHIQTSTERPVATDYTTALIIVYPLIVTTLAAVVGDLFRFLRCTSP